MSKRRYASVSWILLGLMVLIWFNAKLKTRQLAGLIADCVRIAIRTMTHHPRGMAMATFSVGAMLIATWVWSLIPTGRLQDEIVVSGGVKTLQLLVIATTAVFLAGIAWLLYGDKHSSEEASLDRLNERGMS